MSRLCGAQACSALQTRQLGDRPRSGQTAPAAQTRSESPGCCTHACCEMLRPPCTRSPITGCSVHHPCRAASQGERAASAVNAAVASATLPRLRGLASAIAVLSRSTVKFVLPAGALRLTATSAACRLSLSLADAAKGCPTQTSARPHVAAPRTRRASPVEQRTSSGAPRRPPDMRTAPSERP